jgi:Ca2+-binding EF-hand superfamily protein
MKPRVIHCDVRAVVARQSELRIALGRMKLRMRERDFAQLWSALDADLSGEIARDEFVKLFFVDLAEFGP